MLRPWSSVPIDEKGELLRPISSSIKRITPHPYIAMGAPYGQVDDPFWLREGVVSRLDIAQKNLVEKFSNYRLAIFDAWRPISVQNFMFKHAIAAECRLQGLEEYDFDDSSEKMKGITQKIQKFWAPPSDNPVTPPPHSTGGAIDLTLVDLDDKLINMGGEIDEISVISEPDFYKKKAQLNPDSDYAFWHERRKILSSVMVGAGFVQHPNEWWHFSFGDQLWAWFKGENNAIYGKSMPPDINSFIE